MPPTLWERVKTGSKKGFDATWKAVDKVGAPVNRLSNKLGSEAFWPTTLDKESDKAARILKSFCKDGFYAEEEVSAADGPKQKQRVVKKIPSSVIKNAKGLAIFTTMRTGLWISGAGGSGILVARLPDGSWSPPSGILLHTAGLGFLVGVDIYDCVVVINTEEALQAFTKIRCTLGSEISVVAGPVGAGAILESEVHKRQAPIFTYLKSRGFYAGVQIDGTVIIERTDENERFYRERIPVANILEGKVRHPPLETRMLMETIKAAQGDTQFDESALPSEPPPGDFVVDDGHMFGVPDKEDPDPYGVLALEKEGLSLKEAGTHKRASWETFSFNPSPTSPVYQVYARNSQDRTSSIGMRNSWRTSALSNEPKTPSSLRPSSETQRGTMTDTSTQTDYLPPPSPGIESVRSGHSRRSSRSSTMLHRNSQMRNLPENEVLNSPPPATGSAVAERVNGYTTPPVTPPPEDQRKIMVEQYDSRTRTPEPTVEVYSPKHDAEQRVMTTEPTEKTHSTNQDSEQVAEEHKHLETAQSSEEDDDDDDEDDDDDYEEAEIIEQPIVHSVRSIQPTAPRNMPQARVVTVAKREPPKLPPRNPNRGAGALRAPSSETVPSARTSTESSRKAEERSTETESDAVSAEETKEQGEVEAIKAEHAETEKEELVQNVLAPMSEIKLDHAAESEVEANAVQTANEHSKRTSMPGGFD